VNSTAPAQFSSLVTTGKRKDEFDKSTDGCPPSTTFPAREVVLSILIFHAEMRDQTEQVVKSHNSHHHRRCRVLGYSKKKKKKESEMFCARSLSRALGFQFSQPGFQTPCVCIICPFGLPAAPSRFRKEEEACILPWDGR
jgi:hypothetical protein